MQICGMQNRMGTFQDSLRIRNLLTINLMTYSITYSVLDWSTTLVVESVRLAGQVGTTRDV
jgi:hypothetical protein